jgi:predicted nucleic acid-binding protein
MNKTKLFLDTVFIQAILNPHDQYHQIAMQFLPYIKNATAVWVTEAIFMEVGNALSCYNRSKVSAFIKQCYQTDNLSVVTITSTLFQKGLKLYESRSDKSWGLVDCFSFIVMEENQVTEALTSDIHFIQAGFQALLR